MPNNYEYRKPFDDTGLDYYDTESAVNSIQSGAYERLPFTSKVLAENLVRRCKPTELKACLEQII